MPRKQAFNDAGQVGFEEIAIDLPQARFWITAGLATINVCRAVGVATQQETSALDSEGDYASPRILLLTIFVVGINDQLSS